MCKPLSSYVFLIQVECGMMPFLMERQGKGEILGVKQERKKKTKLFSFSTGKELAEAFLSFSS